MYHKCLNFLFPPHFLSANAINNSMFLSKRLTINKRYLDNCSLTKTIVNKLIFVIIKKLIFSKALGAWWNW
ncbi:hypothetical protein CU303_01250 [Prochlorococcus marinus str. MU1417]|nr:hypothetical protein [Prochlorococcus marinus str. MU1417]